METIHCQEHGATPYCLICVHLRGHSGQGYFAIEAEDEEPAQAWCEQCDHVLAQQRGWDDVADAQADWAISCTVCYRQRLGLNCLVSMVEGTSPEE